MSHVNRPKPNNKRKLDVDQKKGEMVKLAELIEVKGSARLTLADLRETRHRNDRLVRSIEAPMTTVVTIQRPDVSTDRVELLGWNNPPDPKRIRGTLKYLIPPELALLLEHVFTGRFALDDFWGLLGVEPDKLPTHSNMNQYAVKTAIVEVGALFDFIVTIAPEKTCRRLNGVLIDWGKRTLKAKNRLR